ncbi:hypothetical protein DLAC_05622 [Tieghemostelium lacteum]|uniref:Uncharacterized protein n=1 Tax=Tieghemostelium lacteum TaxID=361077 RepID=A0A151ZGG6_TIELA|nr:hypothetical protein DLAC_05622 [Tieghemostelium lacteum]|eukprot:KYQ93017.1 hypothetical protein DLAC_05622 [Tieghemostelium lacteum]
MTLLSTISDLYLNELNEIEIFEKITTQLQKFPDEEPSLLGILGNIATIETDYKQSSYYKLLSLLTDKFTKIFLVPGPLEYGGGITMDQVHQLMTQISSEFQNIHFLNNSSIQPMRGLRVVGSVMWPYLTPTSTEKDFEFIKTKDTTGQVKSCTIRDQNAWSKTNLLFLQSEIQQWSLGVGYDTLIVLTHYSSKTNTALFSNKELKLKISKKKNYYLCYGHSPSNFKPEEVSTMIPFLSNQMYHYDSMKLLDNFKLQYYQIIHSNDVTPPTTTETTTTKTESDESKLIKNSISEIFHSTNEKKSDSQITDELMKLFEKQDKGADLQLESSKKRKFFKDENTTDKDKDKEKGIEQKHKQLKLDEFDQFLNDDKSSSKNLNHKNNTDNKTSKFKF